MDACFFEYRDYFQKRIKQIEIPANKNKATIYKKPNGETPDSLICARIRPLTAHELEKKHIEGVLGHHDGGVNIYEPRRKVKSKPELNSSSFTLDEVYCPEVTTAQIYDSHVNDLVQWGLEGGTSMLLAYGQTGSGKTFTVVGLEILLVDKLIQAQASGREELQVCIFEVSGSQIVDLLNDRNLLKVQEDAFGNMQLNGIVERSPKTTKDFLDLINIAKTLRSTATTIKNDESSRSHSICRIRILNTESETTDEGNIMLVDLAGSEASFDTTQHSKERMAETREINKSLNVLKECITKRAQWSLAKAEGSQKHVHIPFRTNKLTQVLKSAFDVNNSRTCKTIVIACIAPSMLDVAHSKNTLRYAETLRIPIPKAKPLEFHEQVPITWSNDDVHDWVRKTSRNPKINPHLLAPRENGSQICKLDEDEFVRRALLTQAVEPKHARLLYFQLWSLHIDSRALLNTLGGSLEKPDTLNLTSKENPKINGKTTGMRRKVIRPGMFFRVKPGDTDECYDIVMTMGLDGGEKGSRWICAAVVLADERTGAHELFVTKQAVVVTAALGDDLLLEYDSETRYYYIKEEL